jgi:hypothetical protein
MPLLPPESRPQKYPDKYGKFDEVQMRLPCNTSFGVLTLSIRVK